MMSIDLFKTILELKALLISSTNKSVMHILYRYYKFKKFIDDNIMKKQDYITYQFLFNFIDFILTIPNGIDIEHMMSKNNVLFYNQFDRSKNLSFFKISYLDKSIEEKEPDILYEYSIYPITSLGEIRFEYTKLYPNKEIHESKTFINSLELDPHKDNLYIKSAKYFIAANDKINEVIKIFFKYYIDDSKKYIIGKNKLLHFIWRGIDE